MEKLDAALNNMSHGLCMFGPDNRLLLWNDRYVKNVQAGAILHSILELGRTLALPVIAEGVETEEQREFLARQGCQVQAI
jgi:hypothetical protein